MIFCASCMLLFFKLVQALATNRSIDDQNGDSVTGALPSYVPNNKWAQGNQCLGCFAQPDPQQAFDHSWHDGTVHSGDSEELSITMSFHGMAVYAYCILDNSAGYDTFTNLTFSIDGVQVGAFSHRPDGTGSFLYNILVYANASIPDGNHIFVIHSPTGGANALVLFDYVQYTSDPDSHISQTSSFSKTAGGIAGGIICGAAILLLLFLYWHRCSRQRNKAPADTISSNSGQYLERPSPDMNTFATMPSESYSPPLKSTSPPVTEQLSADQPYSDFPPRQQFSSIWSSQPQPRHSLTYPEVASPSQSSGISSQPPQLHSLPLVSTNQDLPQESTIPSHSGPLRTQRTCSSRYPPPHTSEASVNVGVHASHIFNMSSCAGPSTAVFTPILPTELWLRIFQLATEPENTFETGYLPFHDPQPLCTAVLKVKRAIVLVCKRWGALGVKFLYEDIRIVGRGSGGLLDALERTEGLEMEAYGHHVRRITLSTISADLDAAVLKQCPYVEVLIKPECSHDDYYQNLSIIAFPFPDRTFKPLESLKRIDWCFGPQYFRFSCYDEESLSFLWHIIQLSPNLSYLSLMGRIPWGLRDHARLLHDLHLEQLQVLRVKDLGEPFLRGVLEWEAPNLTHLVTDSLMFKHTGVLTHSFQLLVIELPPDPDFFNQPFIKNFLIMCPQLQELSYFVEYLQPPEFDEGFVSHASLQCVRLHAQMHLQIRRIVPLFSSREHVNSHFTAISTLMSVALERVILHGDWNEFFGIDSSLAWLPIFAARNCTLEFHD